MLTQVSQSTHICSFAVKREIKEKKSSFDHYLNMVHDMGKDEMLKLKFILMKGLSNIQTMLLCVLEEIS